MDISLLAIDLAKTTFQLHGNNLRGKTLLRKKLRRNQLSDFVANIKPCTIVMEACGGAHYWAQQFKMHGHEIKLISPQFVKPFVKGNKNDSADAEAIAEAAVRPNMRFVPVKSDRHIELQAIHRIRERLVKNRTAICNEIRGILTEFGIVLNKGIENVREGIPKLLLENTSFTGFTKNMLADLYSEYLEIDKRVQRATKFIEMVAKEDEGCKKLTEIPGIGPMTATAILTKLSDPHCFKNGRHFAAFLGLVPRHEGTGGKNKMLGISKRGDKYLRSLMVHGARARVFRASAYNDKTSKWVTKIRNEKGYNKASIALANKNARIAWALIANQTEYKNAV